MTQASSSWDEDNEYWACDAEDNLESSKTEDDNDDDERPTKRAQQEGTQNSNLVEVVSDGFSMGPCKILTLPPESCHHRFHALDKFKSEMQCPTFDVRSIFPLNQCSRTCRQDTGTCRPLHISELDP